MKVDLEKEIHKEIEHKFVIPIKDLEGTIFHPDYDWSTHKYTFYCNEDDEE